MLSNHETDQVCPICRETTLRRVSCSHEACSFVVTTCPRCDRPQVVGAFVADHEKDCIYSPAAPLVVRPAKFVAPRRAA